MRGHAHLILLGWFSSVVRVPAELEPEARFRQPLTITSQAAVVEALNIGSRNFNSPLIFL